MQEVLRKLAERLGPQDGEPVALDGGITNRNYRVSFGGRDHVIRLCGRETELLGIDRAAEREAGEAAFDAGVGPEVVAWLEEEGGCLVTAFVAGQALEPADVRADVARVAQALRDVHHAHRVHATFSPFEMGGRYRDLVLGRGGTLPERADEAQAVAGQIRDALPPYKPVLCHNDLLPANLLDDGDRLWIVDWEYAGMGDPFFDLGNLSVNNAFDEHEDAELVHAYCGGAEPELARVRLMRAASDYREGMWGAVQTVLSDLDFDFAGYAEEHLGRMLDSDWEDWVDAAAT